MYSGNSWGSVVWTENMAARLELHHGREGGREHQGSHASSLSGVADNHEKDGSAGDNPWRLWSSTPPEGH